MYHEKAQIRRLTRILLASNVNLVTDFEISLISLVNK